jgi:hypothetical protein
VKGIAVAKTNLAIRHVWTVALGLTLPLLVGGAGEPLGPPGPFGGESPDLLERNRLLLDKYLRSDVDHYQRLQNDLKAFWKLPRAEQERLRKLDRDLYELDPGDRERLVMVLKRYADWHARLSEEDRQRVDAVEGRQRLRVVREIRERQFLERIPTPEREKVEKLSPKKRRAEIARMRRAERTQRRQWTGLFRVRRLAPKRMSDLPREVREFVADELLPRLTAAEKKKLAQAQTPGGRGPKLTRLLVELSERHPVLPPGPGGRITGPKDLPPAVRRDLGDRIAGAGLGPQLADATGHWPDFALVVAKAFAGSPDPLPPLGASRPEEFPPLVRAFLKEKLEKALTGPEKGRLKKAEGTWPDYPLLLLQLAEKHKLVVPGMSLPGPPELWDGARRRAGS